MPFLFQLCRLPGKGMTEQNTKVAAGAGDVSAQLRFKSLPIAGDLTVRLYNRIKVLISAVLHIIMLLLGKEFNID